MTIQPESTFTPTATGLFKLTEEVYRPADGINCSTLKAMLRSPAHYIAAKLERKEPTPAMILGTLAHLSCFEPELFGEGKSHYVKPAGMNFTTKEGRAWRDEHRDKPVITMDEEADLAGMQAAIATHPMSGPVVSQGVAEVSAFAQDETFNVRLKGKTDKLLRDNQGRVWCVDLKTTEDAKDFARVAYNLNYDMQAAFYMRVLGAAGCEVHNVMFIVVERTAPFGVIVYHPDERFLASGYEKVVRCLTRYRECVQSGKWPGYDEEVQTLSIPNWVK